MTPSAAILASIPSPPEGVFHLGPLPLRAYAMFIIIGVIVAVLVGDRRWRARGGRAGTMADVATWAVPFGLVGGRVYHVLTDWQAYFGADGDPLRSLEVWKGGLGIPGAILLGGVGAWIGCRRKGIALPPLADAVAPGIVMAQGIGRLGNWFNQELYGRPTSLPWGLHIDPEHRLPGYESVAYYHPTFLYELLWDFGVAGVVIWADRRFRLGHGRAFAVYVAAYAVGRGWIEALRIDPAHHFFGMRLNDWMSILIFVGAVTYFIVSSRLRPGREDVVEPADGDDDGADDGVAAVVPAGAGASADSAATLEAETLQAETDVTDAGRSP